MNCGNPVHLLVQTYTPPHPHPPPLHSIQSAGNASTTNGASNNGGKIMRVHTSPLHSNVSIFKHMYSTGFKHVWSMHGEHARHMYDTCLTHVHVHNVFSLKKIVTKIT